MHLPGHLEQAGGLGSGRWEFGTSLFGQPVLFRARSQPTICNPLGSSLIQHQGVQGQARRPDYYTKKVFDPAILVTENIDN